MNADVEQLALQKNNFYRDNYRRALFILMIMILICLAFSVILSYQILSTPKAKYYATTTTGNVIPLYSLSMPVVTNNYLLQWAGLAARACYNLDFVHYPRQLKTASAYFTSSGWSALVNAMKASGVLKSLQKNKLYMNAVVSGPAVILDEEIIHGRYSWRVQLPLLVTYTSANENRKAGFLVTMDIMRVPVLNAEKGIQINNFSVVRT